MAGGTLQRAIVIASLLAVISATPVTVLTDVRQEDTGEVPAVFSSAIPMMIQSEPEATPVEAEPMEALPVEPAPVLIDTPPVVADETGMPLPEPTTVPAEADEEPTSQPPPLPPTVPGASMEPTDAGIGFMYNVGAGATGEWMADPEDSIYGETLAFELPTAAIMGDDANGEIYKSHRYGLNGATWGYDLEVSAPGTYDCTLYYAETFSEFFSDEANRTFRVEMSGDGDTAPQEAEFDVMVELGGQEFTAYQREFTGLVVQNMITLRETPIFGGDAFLSGIKCTMASTM